MNRFPVENIDKVEEATSADLASKATQLETSRTIKLTGDVTGSASFNGTGDASITATVKDDSHNHTVANIDGLQTTLDNINDTIESAVSTAGASLAVSGTTLQLKDSAGNVLSTVTTQDTNTTYTAGTGISISSNKITNTGVTSVNGSTGAVTVSIPDTSNLMTLSTNQTITGDKTFTTSPKLPSIEFTKGPTGTGGFIDFHYDQSTADYTSRIIESSSGTITIQGNLNVTGTSQVTVQSAARLTTGRKITIPKAKVSGTITSDSYLYFDGSSDVSFGCDGCTSCTSCSGSCSGSCKGGCYQGCDASSCS